MGYHSEIPQLNAFSWPGAAPCPNFPTGSPLTPPLRRRMLQRSLQGGVFSEKRVAPVVKADGEIPHKIHGNPRRKCAY